MTKREKLREGIGRGLMYAFFALGFISASVAAPTIVGEGGLSDRGLSIVGIGLGATGVWIALGFFMYAELTRNELEECIKGQLCQILGELKKCGCSCQADAAGGCESKPSS